jgi:hypothetical protein
MDTGEDLIAARVGMSGCIRLARGVGAKRALCRVHEGSP